MTDGWQQMLDLLLAVQRGNADAIAASEAKYAVVIFDADEDGRTLLARYPCTSDQVKQFRRNVFRIIEERSSHGPTQLEPEGAAAH